MPLLLDMSSNALGFSIVKIPISFWILWLASVSFIVAWTILNTSCPKFVREYRDYGRYLNRNHSHRWIVWEFYRNIMSLSIWENIVQETLAKGISIKCDKILTKEEYRLCPIFPKVSDDTTIKIFEPVNANRDIYLPIHCFGTRIVLLLQEDDLKLKEKEKELFYILYTQAAKEKPKLRIAFWIFFHISIVLIGINVIKNIALVIF